MAVKEDKTREVLGIFNRPSESATGWQEMFEILRNRGLDKIGLAVADGLKALEDALAAIYPGTPLQKCVTHLKRNMLNRVRHGDKGELADDLYNELDRAITVRFQARIEHEGSNAKRGVSDCIEVKNSHG